jgi:hypothetical protein
MRQHHTSADTDVLGKCAVYGRRRFNQMSLPVGSRWLIERSGVPDRRIEVMSTHAETFKARYIGIHNPSEFTGEVWARSTKVINIKQHDHSTAYVAFHSGLRHGSDDEYVGR